MTRRQAATGTRRGDEAAVSSVLGAVLVFGLLVVTLVMIQVQFVPVWAEDREARHMDKVVDQLRVIKADLDRQAGNSSVGPFSDPLTLDSGGGFSFFGGASGPGGDTQFTPAPAGSGVTVTADPLHVTVDSGVPLYILDEDYGTAPTTDILHVDHLRVQIDRNTAHNGDSIVLEITDADGDYAGKAVIFFRKDPPDILVETAIYGADSETDPLTVRTDAAHQNSGIPYEYVNLLDDELLFHSVLAVAEAPFDLEMTLNGVDAAYSAALTTAGGGSTSAGGVDIDNFARTLASGSLRFSASNQYYPSQDFILEHGALVLDQPDGAVVLVPPAFSITRAGSQALIDWTLPALDGDASGLGGARAATVVATPAEQVGITGTASLITLVVPTDYPDAWEAYFENLFAAAGFTTDATTPTNPEVQLGPVTNGVQITVFGPIPNPSDTTKDVVLNYQHATIDLDLRPSG